MTQIYRKLEYHLKGTLGKVEVCLDTLAATGITCLLKVEEYQNLSLHLTQHLVQEF